jgi:hypothetical protein
MSKPSACIIYFGAYLEQLLDTQPLSCRLRKSTMKIHHELFPVKTSDAIYLENVSLSSKSVCTTSTSGL